jgi:hypothetical protein
MKSAAIATVALCAVGAEASVMTFAKQEWMKQVRLQQPI